MDLESTVRRLAFEGYDGFNVTIPHKGAIGAFLDGLDEVASHVGAVNTVVIEEGTTEGFNTDVSGFRTVLETASPTKPLRDSLAIVLGAGGAARAAVEALTLLKARVVVANRNEARAQTAFAGQVGTILPLEDSDDLKSSLEQADVLINATSAGMGQPDQGPLPSGCRLHPDLLVCDLVYAPLNTFLLREAAAEGCRTVDGLEFLVAQAADSFRLWTGLEPDRLAMRRACSFTVDPVATGAA